MSSSSSGFSLSSSWGNGHATTYRALLRALAERGHDILFLERDQPWYAEQRDLPDPGFCRLALYDDLAAWSAAAARSRGRRGGGRLLRAGGRRGGALRAAAGARRHRVLRHRHAGHAGAARRRDLRVLSPELIPGFDLYLSFTGGPTLARLERRSAPGARARSTARSIPRCTVPPAAATRWDLGYLGTYSADRQPALERLLLEPARRSPDRRFVVAGPQYPDDIAWPANVERIDHLPPAAHADFYSACAWTLNVTRADMVAAGWSPVVRLFEAAACATPIVSDRWPGLEDVLRDGEEIRLADRAEDVLALLDWSPAQRAALGEAGRARVLGAHTAAHRAEALEAMLAGQGEAR